MKAVGVIVEYNPFHNGHAHHLQESRKAAEADIVIAVISGPFLQRGEPALVSKWARTAMALQAGADLVIELPYAFATQKAEIFARGAVSILEELRCESFCFGSENGRIEPFIRTYAYMQTHKVEYNYAIQTYMNEGNSYPKAASLAFQSISSGLDVLDLSKPNNILGMEYVHTALSNHFSITPLTIKRIQAGYHETELKAGSIASATGIRKALQEQGENLSTVSGFLPESTSKELAAYKRENGSLHWWEMYWPYLKFILLSASAEQLEQIYDIEEGIHHRMKEAAIKSAAFQDYMLSLKTKRYTWTRLQRMCVHILTNSTGNELQPLQDRPSYLRLLGMTQNGRTYLNDLKKKLTLPLVSRLASFQSPSIQPDIRASQVYAMGLKEPFRTTLMKREYEPPIIMT
ncbi:nucleotidyltransferase [Peribacillus sp. SCS-155]|uniref:nucleotidyltransferase n=1 Tax=Peribacillus sedimenti TaxID=3115297 RepID=UPI00390636EC